MAKIGKKPESSEESDEFHPLFVRNLTREELQKLSIEVKRAGGINQYLYNIKPRVVKLDEFGQISSVIQYTNPTLVGREIEAIPGTGITYQVDIPYMVWEKIISQLNRYNNAVEKASKKAQENQPEGV